MSSTVSVYLASSAQRDELLAFLQSRDWEALANKRLAGSVLLPQRGEGLQGYAPKFAPERRISFQVGPSDGDAANYGAWAACAWAAVKYGEKDREGRPVVYHDQEACPLIVAREPKDGEERHEKADARGVMEFLEPGSALARLLDLPARRARNKAQAFAEDLEQDWPAWQSSPAQRSSQRSSTLRAS